jgi:hypothetical protein
MLDAIGAGAIIEVPALWPLEVANALTVLARRGRLTEGNARPRWAGCALCPFAWIRRRRR